MRRLPSWQCLDLEEALRSNAVSFRIRGWYKNKGQKRPIDSRGIPVKARENLASFFFCYFLCVSVLSTKSVLLGCWKRSQQPFFATLYFISALFWDPDEWIAGRENERTGYDTCVLTTVAELEPHGWAFLSIIKHYSFLSTNHESTNNKQPYRSTESENVSANQRWVSKVTCCI